MQYNQAKSTGKQFTASDPPPPSHLRTQDAPIHECILPVYYTYSNGDRRLFPDGVTRGKERAGKKYHLEIYLQESTQHGVLAGFTDKVIKMFLGRQHVSPLTSETSVVENEAVV